MMGLAADYNAGFLVSSVYKQHYSKCKYFRVWDFVSSLLEKNDRILDLGCGSGQFAQLLYDKGFRNYVGIDFSDVAINMAKNTVPLFPFIVSDLYGVDYSPYNGFKFVSIECFEHLENDLKLIQQLPKGKMVFGIPNYMSKYHCRKYANENFIEKYYESVLSIQKITPVTVWKGGIIFVVEALR